MGSLEVMAPFCGCLTFSMQLHFMNLIVPGMGVRVAPVTFIFVAIVK